MSFVIIYSSEVWNHFCGTKNLWTKLPSCLAFNVNFKELLSKNLIFSDILLPPKPFTNICATFVGFLHDFVPSNSCQISTRTKSTSSDVRWPMLNTKLPAGDGKPYVDPPQFLTVTKKVEINVLTNNSNPEMFQKKITFSKFYGKNPPFWST